MRTKIKPQQKTPRPESEEDVDSFLQQVELVRSSSYIKARNSDADHPIFRIEYKEGDGAKVTINGLPERESTESFLMRIRPLVVYEEELYIGKVATFVFDGKGETAEERLKLYRNALERRRGNLFSIRIENEEHTMWDFMWLHLYGKYFHLEREKRETLKKLENTFGALTEATSLGNLEIYATIASFLADDILAMRAGKLTNDKPANILHVK